MLKAVFLIVAFSTAFVNPAPDDQEFWPFLENPSDLSGSGSLGEMPNDYAANSLDQNFFMDGSANDGEYLKLEPQLYAAEVNNNDGLLAGLGSPSEPFNSIDLFGSGNKVSPKELSVAQPPDFPKPDCGARYLLCCSGRPFGAGLYSKCNWCMTFNPVKHYIQPEAEESQKFQINI